MSPAVHLGVLVPHTTQEQVTSDHQGLLGSVRDTGCCHGVTHRMTPGQRRCGPLQARWPEESARLDAPQPGPIRQVQEGWRRPSLPSPCAAPTRSAGSRAHRGGRGAGYTQDRHGRLCSLGGGPGRAPATPPGQAVCPRRTGGTWGPPRTLDDGTLLLLEGGPGGRPGQQQLLLVKQAIQQVLLPTAVVDFQESQDGEGQPGQPGGPEAKLQ